MQAQMYKTSDEVTNIYKDDEHFMSYSAVEFNQL